MDLIKQVNEAVEDKESDKDIKRLVDQYYNMKLSLDDVREMAGDDLEMLEYSPEEVEKLVPKIVDAYVDRGTKKK